MSATFRSHMNPVYSSTSSTFPPYRSASARDSASSPAVISSKSAQRAKPCAARKALSVHAPAALGPYPTEGGGAARGCGGSADTRTWQEALAAGQLPDGWRAR